MDTNQADHENLVLGSILLNPSCLQNVRQSLQVQDFNLERSRKVYSAILQIVDAGDPLDVVILKDKLSEDGELEKIGGMKYLTALVDNIGTSAAVDYYTEKVKDAANQKNIKLVALDIQDQIKRGVPVDEIATQTKLHLDQFSQKNTEEKSEGSPEALEFPAVMDGVAGQFAKLYSEYLEVPEHFLFMSFLTCLGSVLADRVTLKSELKPQPRLYTILLGESADDRKSTAIIKTINFFKKSIERFHSCWGVGSAEGLQAQLFKLEEKDAKKNGKLVLIFDEFKQFVQKCKIESSVLLPAVNTLFEINRFESHTKTSHVDLKSAYLSILAASTIQTYERIWTAAFTDIGFNNRLFIVPGTGEKRFSFPQVIPRDAKQEITKDLGGILALTTEGLTLDMTQKAKARYHEWYINLEQSVHTKRLDTISLRFMILLALNEFESEVDEQIVEKVIAVANWQLAVRRLHDPIDAESTVAKMEEKIRRVLRVGSRKDRELKQATNASRTGLWFYDMAINNLRKSNEIHWLKGSRSWQFVEQV